MEQEKKNKIAVKPFVLHEIFDFKRDFYKISLVVEMLIIFVAFQILTNGVFLTARNLSNLFMQGATCSIVAISMMLVIVSTNADLSAGNAIGFMGVVAASLQVYGNLGAAPTILVTVLIGIVIGIWHGFWIGYMKLPAFIVTFASQLIFKGGILVVGNGVAIGPVKKGYSALGSNYLPNLFGEETGLNILSLIVLLVVIAVYIISSFLKRKNQISEGFPVYKIGIYVISTLLISAAIFIVGSRMVYYKGFTYAVVILIVLALAFNFIVKNTRFGRYVFAIGGNAEAARLSGINIERTVMSIYILHGILVAIAATVYLGRVGQATAQAGTGFEFTAISGCVIGGTSILGGRGTIIGAIIGTMLMMALDNGMSLMDVNSAYQYVIKGIVLMLAIALDVISKKRKG